MDKKIGQRIKERITAQKMNVTDFASAVGIERSNAYNIFQRDSIDTKLLKKIGQVLEYDFFQDLLEPATIKEIVLRSSVTQKVYVELNLTEEEMQRIGIKDKIVKLLK